ncbi:MAG: hypothetical protein NT088_05475 [Candidatus Omnitrophica bacterium]|nr:hypothetical protein [Candidatus Omnitrophota bacterium]
MAKQKVSLIYRFSHLFTHHPWLKIISFLLAVIVWFYVKGEITRFSY